MAIIRERGGIWHIQWYDPFEKKVTSKSTGLTATDSNYKKAQRYAKQFQEKLSQKYRKQKELGVQRVSLEEAFEHFKRNNQGKNPKTIEDYDRFFKKFTETFNKSLPSTSINKLNAEAWSNEIKKLNYAQNTIHAYGKQLNHFLNFLFEYNYTPMFKINREVKTRPEVKEKIIFTDEDLDKVLKSLKNKNSNFQTAIFLLVYTGLRPSDILNITDENIDLKNRVLRYYSPKRKKYREVAFHEKLMTVLRKRIKEVGKGRLLNYIDVDNLARAIKRYFQDLEIDGKQYTARTFRKTFISLCRSRYDIDASVVMELVGHEHRNTTDRYYNQISTSKMKVELAKFRIPTFKKNRSKD